MGGTLSWLHLAAAMAIGLLVGIERGWRYRDRADGQRIAGIRTFSLLGIVGGLAGLAAATAAPAVAAILLATASGLLAIAHLHSIRATGATDSTSAVAALVVLGLSYFAGSGLPGPALAGGALVTFVLALRNEAHGLLDRVDEEDVRALARFSVIALAVLPFLPEGPVGPYDAWNPRLLWWVVILVTGFSFVGYIANRLFGARHGTIATALIGGAYSSTAVTQSLSQRLGSGHGEGSEQAGIALASAVMYGRVILLVALIAPRLLQPFLWLVLPAFVAAWAAGLWLLRGKPSGDGPVSPGNPIALVPALGFLLFVALAAVGARWAESQFGQDGIAVLLLIMGSMDVDAAIVTAGGLGPKAIAADLAALALAGTILANMTVKLGVTLANARSKGRRAAIALSTSMAVLAASLLWGWLRL